MRMPRLLLIAGLGLGGCEAESAATATTGSQGDAACPTADHDAAGSEGGADATPVASDDTSSTTEPGTPAPKETSEWVSFDLHLPLPADWKATASTLFGEAAEGGG